MAAKSARVAGLLAQHKNVTYAAGVAPPTQPLQYSHVAQVLHGRLK
jgi:hypothetical protein